MKKYKVLFLLLILSILSANAQTVYNGEIIEGSWTLEDNYIFKARDRVTLKPGFSIQGVTDSISLSAFIDENQEFPVTYNTSQVSPSRNLVDNVPGSTKGTFDVSSTGAATYSVPIVVPEGYNGLTPELSVDYNSQGSEGLLGTCFDLSGISSIIRGPSKIYETGFVDPINYPSGEDGNDRFYLNGELMYCVEGEYHGNRPKFRLQNNPNIIIEAFDENGQDNQNDHFKAYTDDGKILEFGYGNNASVKVGNYLLKCMLTRITDTYGNYISYSYKKNETEIYIDKITYSNRSDSKKTEIKFVYETADRPPVGLGGVIFEKNLFLHKMIIRNFEEVVKEYQFNYYRNFNIYLGEIVEKDGNGKQYNSLGLNWTKKYGQGWDCFYTLDVVNGYPAAGIGTHTKRIAIGDLDNNGDMEAIHQQYTSTNWRFRLDFNGQTNAEIEVPNTNNYRSCLISDFNGDGKNEVAFLKGTYKTGSTISYRGESQYEIKDMNTNDLIDFYTFSSGQLVKSSSSLNLKTQGINIATCNILCGDFNGDYITDLFIYNSMTVFVLTGIKSENGTISFNIPIIGNFTAAGTPYVGDFDGDGRSDVMVASSAGSLVYMLVETGEGKTISNEENSFGNTLSASDNLKVADINGDGNTDIVKQEAYIHVTYLSNGCQFIRHTSSELRNDFYNFQFTNGNSDRRTDVFEVKRTGNGIENFKLNLYRALSAGSGMKTNYQSNTRELGRSNPFLNKSNVEFYTSGDFNGDGLSEYLVILNTYCTFGYDEDYDAWSFLTDYYGLVDFDTYRAEYEKYNGFIEGKDIEIRFMLIWGDKTADHQSYLTSVIDGNNNTTKIAYNFDYTVDNDSYGSDAICPVHDPIEVVSYYDTPDGQGGFQRTTMTYSTPRLQQTGIGFLGFKKITSENNVTGLKVQNEYIYEVGSRILPRLNKTTTWLNNIKTSTQTYNWNVICDRNQQRAFPYIESKVDKNELTGLSVTTINTYKEIPRYTIDIEPFAWQSQSQIQYGNANNKRTTKFDDPEYIEIPDGGGRFMLRLTGQQYEKEFDDSHTDKIILTTRFAYSNDSVHLPDYVYENESTEYAKTKHYIRNSNGSIISEGIQAENDEGVLVSRYTTYVLDPSGTYVEEEKNEDYPDFKTTFSYFKPKGILAGKTDKNGLKTSYIYGDFDRMVSMVNPDGTTTEYDMDWVYYDYDSPAGSQYYTSEIKADGSYEKIYYNSVGYELRRMTNGFSGEVYADIKYNSKGQLIQMSDPYSKSLPSSDIPWITHTYYDDGRIKQIVNPGNNLLDYSYRGSEINVYQNIVPLNRTFDAEGLVTQAVENGQTISFIRSVIIEDGDTKLLERTTSADGAVIDIKYDILGRKISLEDPDAGSYSYEYTGFDELVRETKPNGDYVKYDYDELGRVISEVSYNSSNLPLFSLTTDYDTPDNLGVVESVTNTNNVLNFTYDTLARVVSISELIYDATQGNQSFTKSYEYDPFGKIKREIYSQGLTIENVYRNDFLHQVINVSNGSILWQANAYDASRRLTETVDGSNVVTKSAYTNNLPAEIRFERSGTVLTELDYVWNYARNILTQKTDKSLIGGNSRTLTEVYTFDTKNRLRKTTVNGTTLFDIVYNTVNGNINSNSNIGDFAYTDPDHIHAITAVDDDNDLMATNRNITYTPFDKASRITEGGQKQLDITYGVDYERVKSEYSYGSTRQWTRFYALGNVELIVNDQGASTYQIMLSGPEGLIAIAEKSGSSPVVFNYMHTDYQGSIISETWNNTNYMVYSYDAWGKRRNASTGLYSGAPTNWMFPHGYTGHEHIDDFNLINMNGRMYDPLLCRFISPDENIQDPYNVDNYNRYVYCLNNPLSYIDPDGESFLFIAAIIVSAAYNIYTHWDDISDDSDGTNPVLEGVAYGLGGAVSGFLSNAGQPELGAIASGMTNTMLADTEKEHSEAFWGTFGSITNYMVGQLEKDLITELSAKQKKNGAEGLIKSGSEFIKTYTTTYLKEYAKGEKSESQIRGAAEDAAMKAFSTKINTETKAWLEKGKKEMEEENKKRKEQEPKTWYTSNSPAVIEL